MTGTPINIYGNHPSGNKTVTSLITVDSAGNPIPLQLGLFEVSGLTTVPVGGIICCLYVYNAAGEYWEPMSQP